MSKITGDEPINSWVDPMNKGDYKGLTIRQYYAGLMLQGIMAGRIVSYFNVNETEAANFATRLADALINSLNKSEK